MMSSPDHVEGICHGKPGCSKQTLEKRGDLE